LTIRPINLTRQPALNALAAYHRGAIRRHQSRINREMRCVTACLDAVSLEATTSARHHLFPRRHQV
jgi:hypothetical protein